MFGIGVDITHVPRIRRLFTRWGYRFLRRAFAPAEILRFEELERSASGPSPAAFLAARWAAKEALHKALAPRTGLRLDFSEVEVTRSAGSGAPSSRGAPAFAFHYSAGKAFQPLNLHASVSLSHDGEYAAAFVVLTEVAPQKEDTPLG